MSTRSRHRCRRIHREAHTAQSYTRHPLQGTALQQSCPSSRRSLPRDKHQLTHISVHSPLTSENIRRHLHTKQGNVQRHSHCLGLERCYVICMLLNKVSHLLHDRRSLNTGPFGPRPFESRLCGIYGGINVGLASNLDAFRNERFIVWVVDAESLARFSVDVLYACQF